jgi:hypothetical protein
MTSSTPPPDPLRAARRLVGPDVQEILATAVEAAGGRLERAILRSVHDRPGRSLSHVYAATIRVEEEGRDVLLVAHVDARPLPDGAFELTSEQDRVAVWRFPYDPFLPGLASAIDADRVRELLDRLGAPAGRVALLTRAYRPSRRAVVEVTIDGEAGTGRVLYLKVLAGDRAKEIASVHRQLAPSVPVPRVVGVAGDQGIVALEALGGDTLRTALAEGQLLPDPAELVELSERFAASRLSSRRNPRSFAEPRRHIEPLAALVPEQRDRLERVAAMAADIDQPLVPVHGDLHDGQLLLSAGSVTGLLDVDGSGLGLVAQDAGNLIAHVQAVGEVWPEHRDRAETFAVALADAYGPWVGPDALARATAGAWLGLATGPYRAQDEGWRDLTRERIARAERELSARA